MALHQKIALVLFFVSLCVLRAKCRPKITNPNIISLRTTLKELDLLQRLAYKNMKSFTQSLGYGPFPRKPCSLDTSMMYKRVPLKKNTLSGHLVRLQMVLSPLIDACAGQWEKNFTLLNTMTKISLKEASFYVEKAGSEIYFVGGPSVFATPPVVQYSSNVLTASVRQYLKCIGVRSNPTAVAILRYATFAKALRQVMSRKDMQADINFLKTY